MAPLIALLVGAMGWDAVRDYARQNKEFKESVEGLGLDIEKSNAELQSAFDKSQGDQMQFIRDERAGAGRDLAFMNSDLNQKFSERTREGLRTFDAGQQDIYSGYDSLRTRSLADLSKLGGQEERDVRTEAENARQAGLARLSRSGLGGSTIGGQFELASSRNTQDQLARMRERLTRERMGVDADLTVRGLTARETGNMNRFNAFSGLTGDQLNAYGTGLMNRFNVDQGYGSTIADTIGQQGRDAADMGMGLSNRWFDYRQALLQPPQPPDWGQFAGQLLARPKNAFNFLF